MCEYPLRISFVGEQAIDTGGVLRDMLSAFWEEAYLKHFDGAGLLTPIVHAQIDLSPLPILGSVLSHGYVPCRRILTTAYCVSDPCWHVARTWHPLSE